MTWLNPHPRLKGSNSQAGLFDHRKRFRHQRGEARNLLGPRAEAGAGVHGLQGCLRIAEACDLMKFSMVHTTRTAILFL